MIHSKFDLDGALESAYNAVKKTGTDRYVIRQANGITIDSVPPVGQFYEAFRVTSSSVIRLVQKGETV